MKVVHGSDELPLLLSRPLLTVIEQGTYDDYLLRVYQHRAHNQVTIPQVHVVEVSGHDIQAGRLSSLPIQSWLVTSSRALKLDFVDMTPFNDASEAGRSLYPNPIVKFFVEWPRVLYMESVGPRIRCNRIATLEQVDDTIRIVGEKITWLWNASEQITLGEIH